MVADCLLLIFAKIMDAFTRSIKLVIIFEFPVKNWTTKACIFFGTKIHFTGIWLNGLMTGVRSNFHHHFAPGIWWPYFCATQREKPQATEQNSFMTRVHPSILLLILIHLTTASCRTITEFYYWAYLLLFLGNWSIHLYSVIVIATKLYLATLNPISSKA